MDNDKAPEDNLTTDPKERLTICYQCPKFRRRTRTCSICNCFMLVKIHFKKARCADEPKRW